MIEIQLVPGDRPADVLAVGAGQLADVPVALLPAADRATVDLFLAESRADAVTRELPLPGRQPNRVIVAHTGDGSADAIREAGAAIVLASRPARSLTVALATEHVDALVEGLVLGAYRYDLKTTSDEERLCRVDLVGIDERSFRRGLILAGATSWARDLTNTPASIKTPEWFGEQAMTEFATRDVEVTVRDERWLAEQGFGGVVAVGSGSVSPPRLIEARWTPSTAHPDAPHIALVGKGITFDTGGINLKPGESMRLMHTDMAGGAAVLAAMRAIADLELPVIVTALVPAAENSFSGSAMRPGDVIRHYGGRTSEVGNTDAEGRLVLADAIAYARSELHADVIVDIATLTGAMKVALGLRTGGLFASTDDLARSLADAAAASGEPLWRMPLDRQYDSLLGSDVADLNNAPGNPGGITAALFLARFAEDSSWAHLDIAGPARSSVDEGIYRKGATGFGARLLAHWVESVAHSIE